MPSSTQSTIPWLLIATLALTPFGTVTSQPPAWWSQRGVLDPSAGPNDFGPANLGQLNHVATMARDEFDARLPGGAGATIDALIDAWYDPLTGQALTPNPPDQNLAPINLGQLKAVAKPFYDRLIAENLLPAGAYPWTAATTDDANFSPANIGQLKHIFRFDIPALIVAADPNGDFDGDGIPNGLETSGSNPSNPLVWDSDGDGVSDGDEAAANTDPNDAASVPLLEPPYYRSSNVELDYSDLFLGLDENDEFILGGELQLWDDNSSWSEQLLSPASAAELNGLLPTLAATPNASGVESHSESWTSWYAGAFSSNTAWSPFDEELQYTASLSANRVWLVVDVARDHEIRRPFIKVTKHDNEGEWELVSAEFVEFVIPARSYHSNPIDVAAELVAAPPFPPLLNFLETWYDVHVDLLPVEVMVDYNRDGKLDITDTRPQELADQGAYNTAGAFQQKGAIIWANLDCDEENVASAKPVPDAIRFWHNGQTFEHSDEDFTIRNGERSFVDTLDGYEAPPASEIRSSCPDVAPIKLSRLNFLPSDSKVLLRVARPEDLKAFHFYKRIPDFAQGDAEEAAIWGGFEQSGAPWAGEDHVIDSRTIDLTKWVNEQASNYVGYQQTRRTEEAPFVFGIEAMLYKGMKYDFSGGAGGKEFDGNLDFTVILKNAQGQETEIDKVRLTCLHLPAFPGAQGFGMWSQGGRGGEVYKVTNLNDSGAGSLREGISSRSNLGAGFPGTERKKPRTIVFEVGGRIALGQEELKIGRGLLTIAGQTASGQGITLTDATFRVSGVEGATGKAINKPNDVIIRYMRSRRATSVPPGKDPNSRSDYPMGPDAFEIKSASRVIVDHCSFSGGIDGSLDIVQANQAANEQPEMDVTAQWCFVHHTLDPHSKSSLIRGKFGARYSILGCFYGHNETRNPEVGWLSGAAAPDAQRMLVDFSDNVIYNWKDRFCGLTQSASSGLRLQFLANYYKPGNDTDDPVTAFQIQSTGDTLYFANNRMRGSVWSSAYEFVGNHGAAGKASSPFITHFTSAGNALTARDKVRAHGGASRNRDIADLAYVNEVPPGTENPKYAVTGTIPSALVSSYASSGALPGYSDSDNDGMADSWESGYAGSGGINKFLPWKDDDGDGWTNLEEYLNKTNPKVGDDPMKAMESNVDGPLF